MASGYKVRIADGSEIGPMDLATVKTWYSQGLLTRDSPVLKPGSKRWGTLADVSELKTVTGGARTAARGASRAPAPESYSRDEETTGFEGFDLDVWRVRAGGVLFLVAALAFGLLVLHPEDAVADLDGTPWLEISLGLVVLGLALLPSWELARKLVRLAAAVIAVGMFPVMGILFAQGVRGAALLAVASAWLMASGFFAYLAPSLSVVRTALCLLPILAGGYGAYRFGYAPESTAQRTVRESASPERRYADDNLGVAFEAPRGWLILKKDNPVLKASAGSSLLLAHPRTGGFAYLVAETAPRGVANLDQYLDRLVTVRRQTVPSLKELGRTDALVGRLSARKASATWDETGVRQHDQTVAWKDGWVYFGLVSWIPEEGAVRAQVLDGLVAGFSTQGVLADRLQQAVQKVTREVPQLTAPAAEALMGRSEAKVLEPDQAFRRSIDALVKVLPTLTAPETQELGQLTTATYAGLAWKDRTRLSAYVERVRANQGTTPQEDREMSALMKMAFLKLPAGQRLRLQAFYEKALRTAGIL
jgi:uncharacterized protein DUF4339